MYNPTDASCSAVYSLSCTHNTSFYIGARAALEGAVELYDIPVTQCRDAKPLTPFPSARDIDRDQYSTRGCERDLPPFRIQNAI